MSAEAHCKGCGEPMTEGRAYELGNYRWHVGCFRCSNCNDQLTAHTNMLVLGDGTLVCANCSYTCSVCSKKIMDMAVLTNDQAFCASCFVCRNCKKRIDDLQYARTSQGIFCMTCHNGLLARKRQRQLQRQRAASQSQSPGQQPPRQPAQQSGGDSQVANNGDDSSFAKAQPTNNTESSNTPSSKSSIASTSSLNRNKDLPGLPPTAPTNADPNTTSADPPKEFRVPSLPNVADTKINSGLERPKALRQVSGGKEGRTLRVPRKQLAPSAFQHYDSSASPASSFDDLERTTTTTSSQSRSDLRKVSDALAADLNLKSDGPVLQSPYLQSNSIERIPTPSSSTHKLADPLPEPVSIGTPPRSPSQSETPNLEASKELSTPKQISPESSGLNVPQRSQLRPVSPAKSWASSSAAGDFSPRGYGAGANLPHSEIGTPAGPSNSSVPSSSNRGTPRSAASGSAATAAATAAAVTTFGTSSPFDRITASPSQFSQQSVQASKSPFGKWWHKRSGSSKSTGSAADSIGPSIYGDNLDENTDVMGNSARNTSTATGSTLTDDLGISLPSDANLRDVVASLKAERDRANEAERRLRQYQQLANVQAEIEKLTIQMNKMRDEHKVLSSRNTQLTEMNAELERQTLEKFGPNSLWGSQNPPPHEPAALAANIGAAGKENPLVTKLDEPQQASSSSASGSSTLQAQFLPLRTAKQWFFRRPNRPGAERTQFGQPYGAGSNMIAVTELDGTGGAVYQKSSGNTSLSGNNNNGHNNNHEGGTQDVSLRRGPNTLLGDTLINRVQVDQAPVPYFVTRCFAEVEKRGLDTEGVYRKPGSKSQVDEILEQFGPNGDASLGEELLGGDIQAVTSAVKQYLRYLAEPVITYDCYDSYIAAGNSKSLQVLRKTLRALPAEHLATLKVVASHLALVASHEKSNLMNVRNLAMVFAPTLAREETGEREIPDMQARNYATHMLIVNADSLLDEETDELL